MDRMAGQRRREVSLNRRAFGLGFDFQEVIGEQRVSDPAQRPPSANLG